MSYSLGLKDPIKINQARGIAHRVKEWIELDAPHLMRGGTFYASGTSLAKINITYNYAPIFRKVLGWDESIRFLYGMTGAESIPFIKAAIKQLADDVDEDYWKPTEGNAKRALYQCLALAQMCPDGVWDGD